MWLYHVAGVFAVVQRSIAAASDFGYNKVSGRQHAVQKIILMNTNILKGKARKLNRTHEKALKQLFVLHSLCFCLSSLCDFGVPYSDG